MSSSGEKFIYFLVGGFVGASVALLLAPQSGEDTRNYLEQKYREGADRLSEKAREGREFIAGKTRQVGEQVGGTVERGRETIIRQKEQLGAAIEAGKQAYQEEKKRLEQTDAT